jgi:hypothetical protein
MREREMAEADASLGASQTRLEERITNPGGPGKTAGKESEGQTLKKRVNKIKECIEKALGIGSGGRGDDLTWQRVEKVLRGAVSDLGELERLTRGKSYAGRERGRMEELVEDAVARGLKKALAAGMKLAATMLSGGKKPLWSDIVSSVKLTVKVRLDSAFEGSLDEKLGRIRETIPEAQAIIPHARAKDKVSVVVPMNTRNTLL